MTANGQTLWALSLQFVGFSSMFGAINFLVTIFNMRCKGMTLTRIPLLCWAVVATSTIILMGTPMLSAGLFMLIFSRLLGTLFFTATAGGESAHVAEPLPVLLASRGVHHDPPGFGIVSEVLPVFSRKPIFGYKLIAFSSLAIGIFGFLVWAHHMFTSGMDPMLPVPFMLTSMIVAVPTRVKIFSWLATIWGGRPTTILPSKAATCFPR